MLNIGLGLVESVAKIAVRAGDEIMKVYGTNFSVEYKKDTSPLTLADELSEDLIIRSIREGITDKFPIISEEASSTNETSVPQGTPFWLVDPLDGTKEFVNRNDDFTVNIALIENNTPVLGVIYVPAKEVNYWGSAHGSYKKSFDEQAKSISCQPFNISKVKAAISRSHKTIETIEYLKKFKNVESVSAGSSLKFCLIAEGSVDLYPRFGRTMEWDTAAGHAIIKFAGGNVKTIDGKELVYGKTKFENTNFIASGPGFLLNYQN